MSYLYPHGDAEVAEVTNFAKKMFALMPLWDTLRETTLGIDGNINFASFRFSFVQINPEGCDYPVIVSYPALEMVHRKPSECFNWYEDGPYRKNASHNFYKFKGMDDDIDFIAADYIGF